MLDMSTLCQILDMYTLVSSLAPFELPVMQCWNWEWMSQCLTRYYDLLGLYIRALDITREEGGTAMISNVTEDVKKCAEHWETRWQIGEAWRGAPDILSHKLHIP